MEERKSWHWQIDYPNTKLLEVWVCLFCCQSVISLKSLVIYDFSKSAFALICFKFALHQFETHYDFLRRFNQAVKVTKSGHYLLHDRASRGYGSIPGLTSQTDLHGIKDVRAHCYCASLVRTLYMTWRVPRPVF